MLKCSLYLGSKAQSLWGCLHTMRGHTGGLVQEVLDIYKRTGIPNPLLFKAAMVAVNDTYYTWEMTQLCVSA